MNKRTYALIQGVIGGCATIASAVVTFFQPSHAAAIVAAIGIGATAVTEICTLFVTQETNKQ
jgi:hypothetical protein